MLCKKVFLEILQNLQENTCATVYFLLNKFIKKGILAQVFSWIFYKISKNTFSYRTPPVAASGFWQDISIIENKNCHPSLQSALTRKRDVSNTMFLYFRNLLHFLSRLHYRLFSGLTVSEKLWY